MIQHHLALAPLLDRHVRRLAKYSRYNRSEKGRTRIERYRATPYIRADGLRMGTKGMQNRETSQSRRVDKQIAAGEAAMRNILDAYNAKHGYGPASVAKPVTDDALRGFMRRVAKAIEGK